MRKGDLVHVPSNVLLVDEVLDLGSYIFTTKPEVGVFLGNHSHSLRKYCKIFCMGKVWTLQKDSAFEFVAGDKKC
jgi:hypothetical protein